MSFMKMADMPTLSHGQTLWNIEYYNISNIINILNYLEHGLTLGRLGSVLLPDGSELLQHLELGLAQVGLHVGVPVVDKQMITLPLYHLFQIVIK